MKPEKTEKKKTRKKKRTQKTHTEVHQVLLDLRLRQRLRVHAEPRGLLDVDLRDQLREPALLELGARHPRRLRRREAPPAALVLVAALELAAADELLEHALGAVLHLERLLQRGLLLLGQDAVDLGQVLAVLADGVAPLDVLVGRLLEVPKVLRVFYVFFFFASGEFFFLRRLSFFLSELLLVSPSHFPSRPSKQRQQKTTPKTPLLTSRGGGTRAARRTRCAGSGASRPRRCWAPSRQSAA